MAPFALHWPRDRSYQPKKAVFSGPITGSLSSSTKGEALAALCSTLQALSLVDGLREATR